MASNGRGLRSRGLDLGGKNYGGLRYALGKQGWGGLTISNTVKEGLDAWTEQAQKALTEEMLRTCNMLRNKMVLRLRWRSGKGQPGGRATGQLAHSIVWNVRSSPHRIEGGVGAGVHYAKYVEGWNSQGQHVPIVKHFVPFSVAPGLQKWLLRHGVEGVENAKGWVVGGPDFPSPFMEPTLKEQEPQIAVRFAAALQRTMNG